VVKTVRRRRLVDVQHRVVFGTIEAVQQILSPRGCPSKTALVERRTLAIRQRVAAGGRRGNTRRQGADSGQPSLALFHV